MFSSKGGIVIKKKKTTTVDIYKTEDGVAACLELPDLILHLTAYYDGGYVSGMLDIDVKKELEKHGFKVFSKKEIKQNKKRSIEHRKKIMKKDIIELEYEKVNEMNTMVLITASECKKCEYVKQ